MYLGRVHIYVIGWIDDIGCSCTGKKGLLDWCICNVIGWSCGRLARTDSGADGDFGSVIVRIVSRRWFGQIVIWLGDVRVVPWS